MPSDGAFGSISDIRQINWDAGHDKTRSNIETIKDICQGLDDQCLAKIDSAEVHNDSINRSSAENVAAYLRSIDIPRELSAKPQNHR
jgi:hypothetical protein